MNIIQITPGAGGMYCGNCFRDNALVLQWRRWGHEVLMVPLYLPMSVEDENQASATPIFFGGISVFLEQVWPWFRHAPRWLHGLLASRPILKWAAGRAAQTRPDKVGPLTLSMLRGEDGRQARELEELVGWLQTQPKPNVVCISNALLAGMAARLKARLHAPVVCALQGEDSFLDGLPEPFRASAWESVARQASHIDLFIAPSRYFADLMTARLNLPQDKVRVVMNGIALDGYAPAPAPPDPPVLGYFARMCREKGLELLVDAYIHLRQDSRFSNLKLRVGGGCGPGDAAFVQAMQSKLQAHRLLGSTEFCPNLDRTAKQAFYRSLSIFSTPAIYGEAFGLYVIEAMASGVPVVQPAHGAFPELIEATGGGVLCQPGSPTALAATIGATLSDPGLCASLGDRGRNAVLQQFTIQKSAETLLQIFATLPPPSRP